MQLLRRGDSGPAVVEIRSTLRRFGLLGDSPESPGDDRFDHAVSSSVLMD